jgi:hypothetical protein
MRGPIDLDGDGHVDLRWRRLAAPGGNLVWNMNRLVSTGYSSLPGESDLLWDMTIA